MIRSAVVGRLTGSRILSRRSGSTGTGLTGCLRPVTYPGNIRTPAGPVPYLRRCTLAARRNPRTKRLSSWAGGTGELQRRLLRTCYAKCDSAGVRIRQHAAARNDRSRCHHSDCSGFCETYASYRNWPSGGDRNRTNMASLGKAGGRVRLRRRMRLMFGQSDQVAGPRCGPRGTSAPVTFIEESFV